jgi:glutathione S-transferase
MMTTVLRIGKSCGLLSGREALSAYVARCEARPAFQKALADQLAPFAENAPA